MIRLGIIFHIVFISINAKSQNNFSFPDSNTVWSQSGQVAWSGPAGCSGPTWEWVTYGDYSQFYIGNKDTVNGIIYTQIMCSCASGYSCYDLQTGGSFGVSVCDGFQFLYGYLREDSLGRIYFTYSPGTWEYLLYDFNCEVGDTVIFYDVLHGNLDSSNYVSSIDSVLIDTSYRKRFAVTRFEINDSLFDFEHSFIIEGIGSTRGLLGNYWSVFPSDLSGYGIDLICFSQNGKILYPQIDSGECEIVTTSPSLPVSYPRASIFPNPVSEYLNVYTPGDNIHELKVTNILGEVLIMKKYLTYGRESIQLDVREIPEGAYVLLLSGQRGRYSMIFIKQ